MVNPLPLIASIPTETWVKADWEDFLTFADDPMLVNGRFYYDQGYMRIEMSPLGIAHGRVKCLLVSLKRKQLPTRSFVTGDRVLRMFEKCLL